MIGDGACGKTSLLSVFTLGEFPRVHFSYFLELIILGLCMCVLEDGANDSNRQSLIIMFPCVE